MRLTIKIRNFYFIQNNTKENSFPRNFNMLYGSTFQHRAKISSLKINIQPMNLKTSQLNILENFKSPMSQSTRRKISLSKKGRRLNNNIKFKIRASLKGRFLSDTHKQNIKHSLTGNKNPMFGRIHSKFVRRKISKSLVKPNE